MIRVVVGGLVRDERVLLAHRSLHKQVRPNVWDLPGGVVEAGESELGALARELDEELGVQMTTAEASHLCRVTAGPVEAPVLLSVWLVREWQGTPANAAPEEHDDIAWFDLEDLPPLAHELVRRALVDAVQNVGVRGFGRTGRRGGRTPGDVWRDWMAANDSGDVERAGRFAAEMTEVDPTSFGAWFEAGLHAKARRDWPRCAEWNQRAMELFGPQQADEYGGVNPAAWNLGIAATAIGDWALARRAWSTFGVTGMAEASDAPIDMELGQVPVRLNPDRPSLTLQSVPEHGETEVVWCWRRSPAHAVIASVPLPESGHRFRDVVLHDGEPKGTRRHGDAEVPVFDQLERLEESGLPTWQLQVEGASEEDLASLADLVAPRGLGLDDWSGISVLCSDCSHGSPDPDHVHPPAKPGARTLGLAGDESALTTLLDQWVETSPSRPRLLDFALIW